MYERGGAGRDGGSGGTRRGVRPERKGKRTGSQRETDARGARRDFAQRYRGSGGVSAGAGDGGTQDHFHREKISRATGHARKERPIAGGIGKCRPCSHGRVQQGRLRSSGSKLRDDGGSGLAAANSKSGAS